MTATRCPIHSWCTRDHDADLSFPEDHQGDTHEVPTETRPVKAEVFNEGGEPRLFLNVDEAELTAEQLNELIDMLGMRVHEMRSRALAVTR